MSKYTPTTEQVRSDYAETFEGTEEKRYERFDRWLAAIEREAAAKALEEAPEAIKLERPEMGMHILPTPYRDGKCHGIDLAETVVSARAAEIREGESE